MATHEHRPRKRIESLASLPIQWHDGEMRFLSILFVLNLLLGTFNLLPVPPLDGHNVITLLMSDDRPSLALLLE